MFQCKGFKFNTVTEVKAALVKLPSSDRQCSCGNMIINQCLPPRRTVFAAVYGHEIVCFRCHKAYKIKDLLNKAKELNLVDIANLK